MDEQRALMDMLMGRNRDNTDEERRSMRKTKFSDAKICKYALCGMCPYALFKGIEQNTRRLFYLLTSVVHKQMNTNFSNEYNRWIEI